MAKLPDKLNLEMSRKRALELGLLVCMCGHPENNHFDWKPYPCAQCGCKKIHEIPKRGIKVV